jgi:hypothetical protein
MLWMINRWLSPQNLEPEGLTRKIFWNKELAVDVGLLFRADLGKSLTFL